jgi:hypothetical protein
MKPLKAEQIAGSKWRVLAIPFGGPFSARDLDGEYFSPRTDIKADWFKDRPILFHHGQDEVVGDETLGVESDLSKEDDGWWATMWLDRANRYWTQVDRLLRGGKMYGSSGALAHLVRKARDGEILTWPHIEQTLTPTPANPLAVVRPAKALAAFDTAGISMEPAMKRLFADLDEQIADLRADLSTGGVYLPDDGDEAAKRKLAPLLDEIEEFINSIN